MSANTQASGGQPAYAPRKPPLRELSKDVKATLGVPKLLDEGNRFTRCLRCWDRHALEHLRTWRRCRKPCPRCSRDRQHWGEPCPKLLAETNDEWWRAHANTPKPGARPPAGPLQLSRRTSAGGLPTPSGGWNHQIGNGSAPSLRAGQLTNTQALSERRRSRSPSMERVSQYRDRESNRDRASGTTGSLSVRPFDPRPRPAQNNNDAAAQELGAQSAKEHERDPQRAPERQISSLEPGEIPVPTELHWSNGAVTAPTVRDLLVNDECMSMIIHQTMLFTDFFARHPEATLGDSIVTDEMRRYLDDVRAFYPDYLSTRATSEATPRPEFNDSGTTARCGGNEEGSGVKRESSNGGGGGKGRDVKREGSADRIAAVYGRR